MVRFLRYGSCGIQIWGEFTNLGHIFVDLNESLVCKEYMCPRVRNLKFNFEPHFRRLQRELGKQRVFVPES